MRTEVIKQLLELNASFYQTFAQEFSATRQRLQPGVRRLLDQVILPGPARSILDLGCGNGELALALLGAGYPGAYLGLDFSAGLLAIARERMDLEKKVSPEIHLQFRQVNLAEADWDAGLGPGSVDVVLAFAVLHHLPGAGVRTAILRRARSYLMEGGLLLHSEWQFGRSPRWSKRVLPWSTLGLADEDVDAGDALLDWRDVGSHAGPGLRYVHQFSQDELAGLAAASRFTIRETFYSDGRERDLSLYQVWEASAGGLL